MLICVVMDNSNISIRGKGTAELGARLDAFADANALSSRVAAAKFLLNKALIAEGFGAAVTAETTAEQAARQSTR